MKKIVVTLLALMIIFGMVACSSQEKTDSEPETPVIGMPNPVVDKESLDEVNREIGCKFVHPPVMGTSDEMFFVITTEPMIGEYRISINGTEYMCRASRTEEDITGVYLEGGTLGEKVEGGNSANIEGYSIAKWFVGDMQYVIYTEDADGSLLETVKTFAEEMQSMQ